MRDVEPVLATEGEEQVVAGDARDLLRLEPEQLAHAVVLVDDVVAGAEVGEGGERPPEAGIGPRRPLAKHLRVREQDEPEVAPDEAAPRRCDGEAERRVGGQLLARLQQLGVHAPQQVLLAQRLAAVRERDDDPLARAHERRPARSPPR